jgi:uncharacterized membrane protein YhaH (DUF805 family)
MNVYFTVLKKFTEFSGRSRMSEFWNFTLINFIFMGLAMILDYAFGTFISPIPFGIIFTIYFLLILLPSIAVFVRRMHDVGKSGWFVLLSFIPVIGTVWLLALCITEGNSKKNEYGPNPKAV